MNRKEKCFPLCNFFTFFQVLSPDDVAFRLPSSQNFNGSKADEDEDIVEEWVADHSVCVTLTNPSGILFLTFLSMIVISLISSSIITARRCWLKRRKFEAKKKQIVQIKSAPIPPKKLLEQQQQKCSKKWNWQWKLCCGSQYWSNNRCRLSNRCHTSQQRDDGELRKVKTIRSSAIIFHTTAAAATTRPWFSLNSLENWMNVEMRNVPKIYDFTQSRWRYTFQTFVLLCEQV